MEDTFNSFALCDECFHKGISDYKQRSGLDSDSSTESEYSR